MGGKKRRMQGNVDIRVTRSRERRNSVERDARKNEMPPASP